LKDRLVPIAEEVNRIAVEGVPAEHIAAARSVLLAIIETMARDEERLDRPLPSTRAVARMVAAAGRKRRRAS
jgi:hypothetical protein